MVYGHSQFYRDELNQWRRIIVVHKEELQETLRQVNLMLSFPVVSLPDSKTANLLIDRLSVQGQQFDHLSNHVTNQLHRLMPAHASAKELDFSVSEQQEGLRAKMKSCELNLIKTKYDCSMFLSSFFQVDSVFIDA